jgi:hypothetical protein
LMLLGLSNGCGKGVLIVDLIHFFYFFKESSFLCFCFSGLDFGLYNE